MNVLMPTPGSYVIAVSGGVDSVALLHRLRTRTEPALRLVVAHFDHGIRDDSEDDRWLVQGLAETYGLPFVYDRGRLGAGTSEATAREARYNFLRRVQRASNARAIITAHHQDDVLETAIINLIRGTGRKGLTALSSRHDLERPLLDIPKQDIIAYAKDQGLVWFEDSTNQNLDYLRNYVRHRIVPRFDVNSRQQLLSIINDSRQINHEIDTLLVNHLHGQSAGGRLDRSAFNQLPHSVAREVMAAWLRAHGVTNFDSRTLERLVVAAKTAPAGQQFDVLQGVRLQVLADHLALEHPER